jgi:hypothetical protein
MEVKFDPWTCVHCGYVMNSTTGAFEANAIPDEGDVTLCLSCAEPFILHDNHWVSITDEELIDMPSEQKAEMSKVQTTLRKFHKEWGWGKYK